MGRHTSQIHSSHSNHQSSIIVSSDTLNRTILYCDDATGCEARPLTLHVSEAAIIRRRSIIGEAGSYYDKLRLSPGGPDPHHH
ncbi:hypothetical protein PIB30_074127 [Stylosanthes scabra]|uniref:Uncharacterized protein n=1 Tax=Stylosanthes scabra TaxID=79078 RepID=A0ABU6UPJ0_9FABA|nr:hypothetical protein [Stylosanthes scabra]